MNPATSIAVTLTFVWLGMVLAISFLEAPLKFRAPNVTRQIGLGIGRLVFRALNSIEVMFAIILAAVILSSPPPIGVIAAFTAAIALLAAQLIAVRPFLNRRSDKLLAGLNAPRSRGHYAYVGLEVIKVIALAVAGILLLLGHPPNGLDRDQESAARVSTPPPAPRILADPAVRIACSANPSRPSGD